MKAWFQWLDLHPGSYALSAALPVAFLLLSSASRRPRPAVLLTGLLAILFAGRWPLLFGIHTLGTAEADAITGALSLGQLGPIEGWLSLTQGGPLTLFALLPTHWLGVPQDYFNARLVALLLDGITLTLAFQTLRRLASFSPRDVAWILLPATCLWANGYAPTLYQYHSGHLIAPLLAGIGLALFGQAQRGGDKVRTSPTWRPLAAGLGVAALTGCGSTGVGWAAISLLLGTTGLLRFSGTPSLVRRHQTRCFLGAAVYGFAAGLCWLHGIGRLADVVRSYAFDLRAAAVPSGWSSMIPTVGLVALGLGLPALGWFWRAHPARWRQVRIFAIAGAVLLSGLRFIKPPPAIFGQFAANWRQPRSALGQRIATLARPGDSLAVWGPLSALHVETGLPAISHWADNARSDRFAAQPPLITYRDADGTRTERAPTFLVRATTPPTDQADALEAAFADRYIPVATNADLRLYLAKSTAHDRLVAPEGQQFLTLEKATRAESVVAPQYLHEFTESVRIFAHAPSVLEHPVPAGAVRLRGSCGFADNVHLQTSPATDGATFVVELLDPAGQVTARWAHRLQPVEHVADRMPVDFDLAVPGSATSTNVRLSIEPGANNSCDWTFWENLRFELAAPSAPSTAE